MEYYKDKDCTLYCGDSGEVLKTLQDNSVSLLLCDPPYFKVKNEAWDRQWDKPQHFLSWLSTIAEQWRRILKPNGSLYCFASPQMAARVEVMLSDYFNVVNHIVWNKSPTGAGKHQQACKDAFRSYFPITERIIFCEQYGAKGEAGYDSVCDELRGLVVKPLRNYFLSAFTKSGVSKEDIIQVFNSDGRYTSYESARVHASYKIGWGGGHRWDLCDKKMYRELLKILPLPRSYEEILKEYEELRKEYEELRKEYEELRRPFSVTKHDQYTDVWNFMPVSNYKGKHPCEKPQSLLQHIIKTSTKEGATVCDSFMGIGSCGKATKALGRKFIGIDQSEIYCKDAANRIKAQCRIKPLPGM
jgi:site-specific DNA-methyltransferase (adenine-specific)